MSEIGRGLLAAQDRVTESIILTSPSGVAHEAAWIGDSRSIPKKVAVFEYPDVDGASVQDLGLGSQKWPLTFYFHGEDHDILAINFEASLSERGSWFVSHPVEGVVELQPLTLTKEVQPVKSAMVTTFSGEWVGVTPRFEGLALADIAESIRSEANAINSDAVTDNAGTKEGVLINPDDLISGYERFRQYIKSVLAEITNTFLRFQELTNEVRRRISDAIATVTELLDSVYSTVSSVISAVHAIIMIPSRVKTAVKAKIQMYKSLGEQFRNSFGESISDGSVSVDTARAHDQVMNSVLSAMCNSTTVGSTESRDEAFENAETLIAEYRLTVIQSDEAISVLEGYSSRVSYLGNIFSWDRVKNLIGRTVGYVIDENYSPAVKKSIVIPSAVSTLLFSISQYANRSIESAYDYFIETNGLSGDDIVYLPTGKTVSVYI